MFAKPTPTNVLKTRPPHLMGWLGKWQHRTVIPLQVQNFPKSRGKIDRIFEIRNNWGKVPRHQDLGLQIRDRRKLTTRNLEFRLELRVV